ncbi:MAG: ABC transporter permease [Candidatus Poseidoniales archaeon]
MSESLKRIRIIAGKEIIEFVRDWRTLLATILIPLILFPALFIVLPLLLQSEAAELEALELDIVVQGDVHEDLVAALKGDRMVVIIEALPSDIANLSDPGSDGERLRNNEIDSILRMQVSGNNTWNYSILQFSTSEHSSQARSRVLTQLWAWESEVVNRSLLEKGLDPDTTLDPVKWDGSLSAADTATSGEQAGMILSLFIPMALAIWTASSAMQPSIDMTAGERERGTLEALLCLPCSRIELLSGKWLAVASIAGVSVGLQVVGLIFAITYLASSSFIAIPAMSITSILLIATAVILFAIMVVAFELALAMKAQSVKEAGTLLAPSIILIVFPALFTQVINLDGIESWWFAIPLVNVLLALRELLLDRIIIEHVVIWALSSMFYSFLAAWFASRQFKREDLVASLS